MNKVNTFNKISVIITMLIIIIFIYIIFYNYEDKQNILVKDINKNNYLDILELNNKDSKSFNLWFSNIIINIFNENMHIPNNYSDCAGLIRYAYKEALKKHDQYWLNINNYNGFIYEDVKKFNYPDVPFVKTNIFLIDENIHNKNSYSNFASARYLIEYNMKYLGKNMINAKTGDVLAYFHPNDVEYPYHLMIYIEQNKQKYVIYHTGPISNENPGELRLTKIENLKYADPSWIANKENKNFLGYYRFKILSDNYE
jgi:hypothetical protein